MGRLEGAEGSWHPGERYCLITSGETKCQEVATPDSMCGIIPPTQAPRANAHMALDLRGSFKNRRISYNCYVVLHELFTNSVDSYLIRKSADDDIEGFKGTVEVEVFQAGILEETDLLISFTDNGAGFQPAQTKAFVTIDTTYKDDLSIAGISKCKGLGRVQYFHYFRKVSIRSVYKADDGSHHLKTLMVDENTKEISESDFTDESTVGDVETNVTLHSLRSIGLKVIKKQGEDLDELFSPERLKTELLLSSLQLLVTLENVLGNFSITFKRRGDETNVATLTKDDLPKVTETKSFDLSYRYTDGEPSGESANFRVSHYVIDPLHLAPKRNLIAFCARSAIVQDITKRYLKSNMQRSSPIAGKFHIILVHSDYLDDHVNDERNAFHISEESLNYLAAVPMSDIEAATDEVVFDLLSPPDWDRAEILAKAEVKYGISRAMIEETNVKIRYTDTEDSIALRVLNWYQSKIVNDTADIFDLERRLEQLDPQGGEYRDMLNDLAWRYTSSIKYVDMANLSQLVVRRAAVLKVLESAIGRELAVQKNWPSGRRQENEYIIHSVVFPRKKDKETAGEHDIWILGEEWQFADYIASDMPLSKYRCLGETVFAEDVDDAIKAEMIKVASSNKSERPDIAVFCDVETAIIVEFKAPGVPLDRCLNELSRYAAILAMSSGGKLRRFYGYLIGDTVDPIGMQGWKKFATCNGWFHSISLKDSITGADLGEIYMEVLTYQSVVARAKARLEVFKRKLSLPAWQK